MNITDIVINYIYDPIVIITTWYFSNGTLDIDTLVLSTFNITQSNGTLY